MTGKIWPDMEQYSDAWWRARAGRPTASQFGRILTPGGKDSSAWEGYACELMAECAYPDETPSFEGNKHTDRGNEREPIARDLFAQIMGLEVRQVGFVTREDGVIGASPDGLVYVDDRPVAGLEIKCQMAKNHVAMMVAGEMPSKYKPQVHGSMSVCGLNTWYFMAYCPRFRPMIIKVDWDEYTDKMVDALDRFFVYYSGMRKRFMDDITAKSGAFADHIETIREAWDREGEFAQI